MEDICKINVLELNFFKRAFLQMQIFLGTSKAEGVFSCTSAT